MMFLRTQQHAELTARALHQAAHIQAVAAAAAPTQAASSKRKVAAMACLIAYAVLVWNNSLTNIHLCFF